MQTRLFEHALASQPALAGLGASPVRSASLVVLSSSSGGNCSALILDGPAPSLLLIDLGLSPRRTLKLLEECGLGDIPIAGVVVTHLDTDHYHLGWVGRVRSALPGDATVFMHRRHLGRADRDGLLFTRTQPFEREFEPVPGVRVWSHLAAHDALGCASLRVSVAGAELGWATDVGRPTDELADHLAGVDVLAIESNYCPRMEAESDRPLFLKRRIMGGSGHLSNGQCGELTRRIGPRRHVVLLHLSRQCNTPELAGLEHAGAPYSVTISGPQTPTGRILLA